MPRRRCRSLIKVRAGSSTWRSSPVAGRRAVRRIRGDDCMCSACRNGLLLFVVLLLACALHAADTVDPKTLEGKVLFGYQGWFNCPGDGSPRPTWSSWARGVPSAALLTIDMYPDLRELDPDELCE